MPPIGLALGGVDFTDLAITLKAAADGAEAVTLNYGRFIQTVVDFLIIALAIFVAVRVTNRLKRKDEAQPAAAETPAPSPEQQLLTEIRDILKARQ